ncbi:hypothetical protein A134_23210 [Vibrio crassostreae 9CS106]|uniref:Uncharacterized protein n=1 Tax=Vibrio crassostreae 9CS106 TaxID=1191300 RepID=A0A1B1C3C7_9VIBR|nr:hypothetical protein A134_23210 [Vibrio crassostreae 9CS106]
MSEWDKLSGIGSDAPLKETSEEDVMPKYFRKMPRKFVTQHKELRVSHQTSHDFTSYVMEAIREKLAKDGKI